jgi:chromate transporter
MQWMTEMSQPAGQPEASQRVRLGTIFWALLTVSLCSVGGGGGLVLARRIGVEQRGWITDRDFADIVSLCQFLPGPNIVGIAVCLGTKLRGAAGALAALAGFLLVPWVIGFSLAVLLFRYAHLPVLRHVLGGLSAAAAGLLIAIGMRLLRPHRGRPAALVFAALAFGLMAFTRLPLLLVLFSLLPLSIGVAAVERTAVRWR